MLKNKSSKIKTHILSLNFVGSTNKEFNLRHDWNSLISNNESLKMYHYSDEYFPNADIYVRIDIFCDCYHIHIVLE